jgi:predicted small secreted protein
MLSKIVRALLISSVILLPVVVWFRLNRPIHPQTVIDRLYRQYEDISFVSIDYHANRNRFLGIEREVFTGRFHTQENTGKKRYKFTADAYTGEIMEATEL